MHHVLITYCTLKGIYLAEIAFICDLGATDRYLLCQEGLIHTTTQALDSHGGGELSWQSLNKNRGRMADRTCGILY